MPFKSKAQQRFMFATDPEKAKRWAKETPDMKKLPEKKHPEMNPNGNKLPEVKTASDGRFFEKRSQPLEGNFFRDMSGRNDGAFYEKSAQPGTVPRGGGINVSPQGSQMFGSGSGLGDKPPKPAETANVAIPNTPTQRGKGMGGGMYLGTGEGVSKKAGVLPSDWDADQGLPTGFHRPASSQPEELESGGNRFHSTESEGPDYGVGDGIKHGLSESGRLRVGSGSGSQMGKHASVRFLGTSYGMDKEAKSFAGERSSEFKESLKEGLGDIGGAASEGVKSITKSPMASLAIAALLGRAGFRGSKRLGRAAKKGYKRAKHGMPDPKQEPLTMTEKMMGGARALGDKLKLTT